MPTSVAITEFWELFNAETGGVDPERFYEAFHFCDSEELANSLAELVLAGTKRASAGMLCAYEHEGKRPPKPSDLSVVTNWVGSPLCIIETLQVAILPFTEVTAEFAATEGEGDKSLEYWREAQVHAFSRECARIGRVFSESMLVVCEQFRVVFAVSKSAA